MAIRFSRAEYCLLNFAVHEAMPLFALLDPEIGPIMNMSAPDVPRAQLVDAISSLLSAGLIETQRSDVRKPILSEVEIAEALDETWDEFGLPFWDGREPLTHERTFYFLTARGGSAWEDFARPNWSRYIEEHSSQDAEEGAPETCFLCCTDFNLLERYFFGAFRNPGGIVVADTLRREEISPWQVTYWRTLLQATRLSFQLFPDAPSPNREPFWKMQQWLKWT